MTTTQNVTGSNDSTNLTTSEVMAKLRYRSRSAFWAAVHSQGIPYTRITAHKIVFDPAALNAWMAARSVGGAS